MSNLSLKEQLEALSLGAIPTEVAAKAVNKKPQPLTKPTKQKPAWLEHAQYGVELLKVYFPSCFKEAREMQPLKVGIKQDLIKQLASREDIVLGDKACMVSSLAYYVNSAMYHKTMLTGAARIDLTGQLAGTVTAEEAQYSLDCRKTKLLKKQAVPA